MMDYMSSLQHLPGGPDRAGGDRLTDRAEVRHIRGPYDLPIFGRFWAGDATELEGGPEQYSSHVEYEAARDAERWGDDPFEED
jgi:hypothetical protein